MENPEGVVDVEVEVVDLNPPVKSYIAFHEYQKRYHAKSRVHAFNASKEWDGDQERLVLAKTMPDTHLAILLGRSATAIQAKRRLLKLGL